MAVIVLAADCPWVTDLLPSLETEKSNAAAFTVNVKLVVLVTPPPVPVTVIV